MFVRPSPLQGGRALGPTAHRCWGNPLYQQPHSPLKWAGGGLCLGCDPRSRGQRVSESMGGWGAGFPPSH